MVEKIRVIGFPRCDSPLSGNNSWEDSWEMQNSAAEESRDIPSKQEKLQKPKKTKKKQRCSGDKATKEMTWN